MSWQVLADESVEDLSADALRDLAVRDSLSVSSETVLFNALERWCNRECKRCQLQLSAENRRSVLGYELLFSPRFLLMSSHEFLSGPMQSGIFDQSETTTLMAHILNAPARPIAANLPPNVIERLKTPRRKPFSSPINLSLTKCKKNKKDSSKKSKSAKKQRKQKEKCKANLESPDKKCSKSCFLENMFRVLSCLFDWTHIWPNQIALVIRFRVPKSFLTEGLKRSFVKS